MAESLESALAELDLAGRDQGTAELARTYARAIDDGTAELSKVGPALLAVLESLLMTPRARNAIVKGGTSSDSARPANPLDELRAKRERYKLGVI